LRQPEFGLAVTGEKPVTSTEVAALNDDVHCVLDRFGTEPSKLAKWLL
jgi:hypothetical protein